jgi:predicted glutamine amidotransferase
MFERPSKSLTRIERENARMELANIAQALEGNLKAYRVLPEDETPSFLEFMSPDTGPFETARQLIDAAGTPYIATEELTEEELWTEFEKRIDI